MLVDELAHLIETMTTPEPPRVPPSIELSRRMSARARQDTVPELALRRALHALGMRYRLQVPVPGNRRRKIDIAFVRQRIAVFVDGCFWHGCPTHGTQPATNREWWSWKITGNRDRDEDTDRLLQTMGWIPVRVWEHEDPAHAAARVEEIVRSR